MQVEWDKQKSQLADLVVEINKPLKSLDRATLITLCTIDVHARDVLGRLIDERVEDVTCFQWQSQLRYVIHEKTKKCQVSYTTTHISAFQFDKSNCFQDVRNVVTDCCTVVQRWNLVTDCLCAGQHL